MSGSIDRELRTLLIVGVHEEELFFGRRVVEGLESPSLFCVCFRGHRSEHTSAPFVLTNHSNE